MATLIKRDSVIPVSTGTVPARGERGGKPLRSDIHCFTETIEMAIHCFLRQVHFKAFDFFSHKNHSLLLGYSGRVVFFFFSFFNCKTQFWGKWNIMDYKTVMLVHLQSFVIITIIVMSLWPSTRCISYSFVIH